MGLHRTNDVSWLQEILDNILEVIDDDDLIDVNMDYRRIAELISEYRHAKNEYEESEKPCFRTQAELESYVFGDDK